MCREVSGDLKLYQVVPGILQWVPRTFQGNIRAFLQASLQGHVDVSGSLRRVPRDLSGFHRHSRGSQGRFRVFQGAPGDLLGPSVGLRGIYRGTRCVSERHRGLQKVSEGILGILGMLQGSQEYFRTSLGEAF